MPNALTADMIYHATKAMLNAMLYECRIEQDTQGKAAFNKRNPKVVLYEAIFKYEIE
jgi:stalled ribosome alternative rescue factor ArfA